MKSLVELWRYVADETATWCHTSTRLDFKTVESRSKSEGVSFLTITLPTFCKDFERSLDEGFIDSSSFRAFARGKGGAIPAFLQGMTSQVFDRYSGRLLDEPSVDCIQAVRQLTLMFGKVEIECTDARKRAALREFIECEQEVRDGNEVLSMEALNELTAMSHLLFGNILDRVERKFLTFELLPKHGPGATADRLRGNSKYEMREWPVRLNHSFPYEDYALPSPRFLQEFYGEEKAVVLDEDLGELSWPVDRVNFLEPGAERPSEVILVPKTLKKPRIIAKEPTAMQYAQQSLLREFVDCLESYKIDNPYFGTNINRICGMIGFRDQTPNQDLAREGSLFGNLATLDLSEASDRVSNLHVMALLSRTPQLLVAVQDCRSTKANVPGHGVIPLAKFASMGSALTFPMEAMVFLTIVFLGIQSKLNRTLTVKDILSFTGKVRVYGDDIIVPVEYVSSVLNSLALFGYKVNHNKSFWNGSFRESCGKEFYAGADVSIVRVRKELPSSRRDVSEIISLVSFRNLLHQKGYRKALEPIDELVGKLLPHYPLVRPSSPVIGRWSDHESEYDCDRTDERLHQPLVRGFVESSKSPASTLDDYGALLKWFIKSGDEPFIDPNHLERSGRPLRVGITAGWYRPF